MFSPSLEIENALRFSRFDDRHPLCSSGPEIELEEQTWRSPEHYVQAKIAGSESLAAKVCAAENALLAYKLNRSWFRPKAKDWKNTRRVYMTRALFIKVQMYDEVRAFLMGTGDELLVETSLYDHYWGIGRDQRGENMLGKIWMDIREKLRDA